MRILLIIISAIASFILSGQARATPDRVALVIGNGAYSFATKLSNPANDAGDMVKALRDIGFDVVTGTDLDRIAMESKIREFSRKLSEARIALFFYAGHGMQVAGKNYLIPIDAKLEQAGDLSLDTIDVSVVMQQMEAQERVNLVFLDACRDNPLARSFARTLGASRSAAVGQGLASIQSAVGTMIVFATQPDAFALDGRGRNSPFTAALLKHIREPGVDISVMMRQVRNDVLAATGRRQVPWDHSSLTDAVVLVSGAGAQQVAPSAPAVASRPVAAPSLTATQLSTSDAAQAWAATKDTTSPAVLQDFIRQFGKTPFGSMAGARLKELRAAAPKPPDKVAVAAPTAAPAPPVPTVNSVAGVWRATGDSVFGRGELTLQMTDGKLTGTWRQKDIVFDALSGPKEILNETINGNRVSFETDLGLGMKAKFTLLIDSRSQKMQGTSEQGSGDPERVVMTKIR